MAYLTQAEWKLRTLMPGADVDALEALYPGFVALQLDEVSDAIDSRLRKRYGAPFQTPYPKTVLRWLTQIVTRAAYLKRGVDPLDPQMAEYIKDSETAWAELLEAADSETGKYDLPINTAGDSAIARGGPRSYSEASPYVGFDVQAQTGRSEDAAGGGTRG